MLDRNQSFKPISPSEDPVSRLIFELSKLPGIGEKTATRLTYFILKQNSRFSENLAHALLDAKNKIFLCGKCFIFTDVDPCKICADPSRDITQICIVERPSDVFSIESTRAFRGTYHVLQGALSPIDGIGPDELKLREFYSRVEQLKDTLKEVILATNPSVEGEATAFHILSHLKNYPLRITKLAHGIPVGGLLEYTDSLTIEKALTNRVEFFA